MWKIFLDLANDEIMERWLCSWTKERDSQLATLELAWFGEENLHVPETPFYKNLCNKFWLTENIIIWEIYIG